MQNIGLGPTGRCSVACNINLHERSQMLKILDPQPLPGFRQMPTIASRRQCLLRVLAICAVAALSSCGGDDFLSAQPVNSDAPVAGATPFIAFVTIHGINLDRAAEVRFRIQPQAGSSTRPVQGTYSRQYLIDHGYSMASSDDIKVPVFGLYAGTRNDVDVSVLFEDGSVGELPVSVTTAAYVDPNGVYDHLTVVQQRVAGAALGYDFMYLRSALGTPVILDTDGQVRWVGTGVSNSTTSLFVDNGFVLGSSTSGAIYRLELDGTLTPSSLASTAIQSFHHDMEPGKTGLFANVNNRVNGALNPESFLDEIQPDGTLVNEWDMNKIVADFMAANGDDPTAFVRPTVDWFHMNTAIYDPTDDSVILSSRENFLIKVDYSTKAIRWIFGDTTKYWYTFPSLRSKAITLTGGGLVPIGQHGVNFAPDGSLLLFNDGFQSVNQPAGAPAGQSRTYAAVSDYTINATTLTAVENWHYDHGQTYDSGICSSAQQRRDGSLLIDYAASDSRSTMHLVGLDPAKAVVFDYKLATASCQSGWAAEPISLGHLFFG
jgi:arylsulfate sulfotransferase